MFYIQIQCVHAFPIISSILLIVKFAELVALQTMSGNLTELRADTQVFSPFFLYNLSDLYQNIMYMRYFTINLLLFNNYLVNIYKKR